MQFNVYQKEDLEKLISHREGETKLGEEILVGFDHIDALSDCPADFVIFGVAEDVGPRANCGRGGADSGWNAFLTKFLNTQDNQFLRGQQCLLLGVLETKNLEGQGSTNLKKLRATVRKIDEKVVEIVSLINHAGKIPILIGGGHNNAYGLIKASSQFHQKAINVVNMDPHADYRALEGRHSGNGFSYAKHEGHLDQYVILGLQENYNSQTMLAKMATDGVNYISFESIKLKNELTFDQAIDLCKKTIQGNYYGVELDLDSVEGFPTSAQTPSGFSANEARKYVYQMAQSEQLSYLHLPESAPSLVEGSEHQVGKLLSFLVTDFIKGYNSRD